MDGFFEKIDRPTPERIGDGPFFFMTRQHHRGEAGLTIPQPDQQIDPGLVGHLVIGYDTIERLESLSVELRLRRAYAIDGFDEITALLQCHS